ncbi:MAG TPA: hypothetical protein VNE38_13250 [Ktedonobacteraceae bacterium]|nr:hypothetical protein [Ktedonobacteraceae bacterium]
MNKAKVMSEGDRRGANLDELVGEGDRKGPNPTQPHPRPYKD